VSRLFKTILGAALTVLEIAAFRPAGAQGPAIVSDVEDEANRRQLEELKERDAQDLLRLEEKNKLKTYPVVIFVPGILGSKIEECDRSASGPVNCRAIWGQKDWGQSFSIADLSIKPDKEYRTTVLDNFKTLGKEVDFYGSGLVYIHGLRVSGEGSLEPFPYDWRQDNRASALAFHNFLCGLPAVQKGRPIVIAAHSMGGLVVKYWFARIYQRKTACPGGGALNLTLQELMFIGTPHYGSPEAIKVLAEGFRLSGGGGVFGFIKELYSRATVDRELNRYGAMFPSVYQLLPIYGHSCMGDVRARIELPDATVTDSRGELDLFSAEAWRQVGWPKHRPAGVATETFYKVHLPRFLKGAEEFLCVVARLDFPADVRVAYFSANAHDTTKRMALAGIPPGNRRAREPVFVGFTSIETEKGDGTVPYEIGLNTLDMDSDHHRHTLGETHEYLLNSREFRARVGFIYRSARALTAEATLADPKARRQLQKVYLAAGPSVFVSLPEIAMSPAAGALSVDDARNRFPNVLHFNRSLMELRGLRAGELEKALAVVPGDGGARSILAGLQTIDGERYPDRPVRIVVAAGPGGASDAVGRVLAQKLEGLWGKPVVIENVAGAGGSVGMARAAKATADGYTMFLSTNQLLTLTPVLVKRLPAGVEDFAPVTLVAETPSVLAVSAALPAKTVGELIALAKGSPGKFAYASAGPGTQQHLLGEVFASAAGVKLAHVPYRGTGPALAAVQDGRVVMTFGRAGEILPLARAGKVRALAVLSPSRSAAAPDVPTIGEVGFANLADSSWLGLLTPAGTPGSIVQKLNKDVAQILALPEVRSALAGFGTEPVGNSPEAFAAIIKSQSAKWEAAAIQAGLQPK
jgi:tripartite-type tricarboxylate transporter receptor subunit TctC